ncbi:MAG: hypothetical protein D6785_02675, partial [Planctomycetota bacterium]
KSPFMATFLLFFMNEIELGDPSFRSLKLVELLQSLDESNPHRFRIGKSLVDLAESSIQPLIESYPKASPGNQSYIIQLLDWCSRKTTNKNLLDNIGSFFAEVLESPSPPLRKQVYESHFLKNPHISEETKERLAQILVNQLEDFRGYQINLHMEEVFENLGKESLSYLEEVLETTMDEEMRRDATYYIGSAGLALEDKEKIESLFAKLFEKLNLPYMDRETLSSTLARLCSSPFLPKERVDQFLEWLLKKWKEEDNEYFYFKALTILNGSPHVNEEKQKVILQIFLDAFHSPPPEDELVQMASETEEGKVFIEDEEESEYFTRLIPGAIYGLQEWACSPHVSMEIGKEIINALITRLQKIQKWELLLGPYNEARIVEALGKICLQPRLPAKEKERILNVLKPHAHRMYLVRYLIQIFEKYGEEESLGVVAAEIAYYLYKRKKEIDRLSHDERGQVYRLWGAIGSV